MNDDDLVVTLNEPKSTIRGHVLKSTNGNDYYAFQDIPYAKPPVGELRFAVNSSLKSCFVSLEWVWIKNEI